MGGGVGLGVEARGWIWKTFLKGLVHSSQKKSVKMLHKYQANKSQGQQ